MKKLIVFGGVLFSLFLVARVYAQPALDIKTQFTGEETQGRENTQQPTQPQVGENQSASQQVAQWSQLIDSLLNRINALELQTQNNRELDLNVSGWLGWWWQIGFWAGIFLLFPWIFVGWQWTHFKFWGFGWPWPWWFWIPLWWFFPWLVIGWQWWLIWWVWWIWIWWLFPWIFWFFWWIIVFKELMISQWHR